MREKPTATLDEHRLVKAPETPAQESSEASEAEETKTPVPSRILGGFIIVIGVLLMALSGLTATPSGAAPENVSGSSSSSESLEGLSVISGGPNGDELYGEPGQDFIVGGAGDDFVEAKDGARDYVSCGPSTGVLNTERRAYGARDYVSCGPGVDVASLDERDSAASDCETIFES